MEWSLYIPQWKTHWYTSWNNEIFIGREGYIDILKAYNQIKDMATRKLFRKPKLKSVQYINLPPIEFYFYVGERYYRRMQPIPYRYVNTCVKRIKNYLESIN
jgi:hypothetical protein